MYFKRYIKILLKNLLDESLFDHIYYIVLLCDLFKILFKLKSFRDTLMKILLIDVLKFLY